MVFNLYILITSDLLVSRTPLIIVLSTEGLSWVNIPFINADATGCLVPLAPMVLPGSYYSNYYH